MFAQNTNRNNRRVNVRRQLLLISEAHWRVSI